jgi:hypothetical protein
MPIWSILQSDFELNLVQPYFIKQLPGLKTDVNDAHWIATCLQKGLIKGSFVPGIDLQQMRQYSRRYRYLSHCMVKVEQRMDNHLQRCNIRFSNYISNREKMYPYARSSRQSSPGSMILPSCARKCMDAR